MLSRVALRVAAYWLRAGCEAARSLKREAKGIAVRRTCACRLAHISRTGLVYRTCTRFIASSAFEVDPNLHTAYTLREHFCAFCRYMTTEIRVRIRSVP